MDYMNEGATFAFFAKVAMPRLTSLAEGAGDSEVLLQVGRRLAIAARAGREYAYACGESVNIDANHAKVGHPRPES
jgi:hypothetical protein